jgi:hypothetical protein
MNIKGGQHASSLGVAFPLAMNTHVGVGIGTLTMFTLLTIGSHRVLSTIPSCLVRPSRPWPLGRSLCVYRLLGHSINFCELTIL